MQRSEVDFQLAVAARIARAAGGLLRDRFGDDHQVRKKGEVDLVTEVDLASERLIVDALHAEFPSDGIVAEEGGGHNSNGDRLWLVDPLDGTTNFAHGYPCFAVSIALEVGGEVNLGVVYDPLREELFSAGLGAGAKLNGLPIHVSSADHLSGGLLCTGFPYDRDEARAALPIFNRVVTSAQGVRRIGAAAIDLCYVAVGRFDGFWERALQPWDVAAGSLIVREAGGRTSDYRGHPLDIRGREIVATNGKMHEELLRLTAADVDQT